MATLTAMRDLNCRTSFGRLLFDNEAHWMHVRKIIEIKKSPSLIYKKTAIAISRLGTKLAAEKLSASIPMPRKNQKKCHR